LTGGIAHDFNNVLAVVLSNLELLRKPGRPRTGAFKLIDNSERRSSAPRALRSGCSPSRGGRTSGQSRWISRSWWVEWSSY
jgi:hypothetical protein